MFALSVWMLYLNKKFTKTCPPTHTHQNKISSMFLIPRENISKPSQNIQCSLKWPNLPGHLLSTCGMCAVHTGSLPILLTHLWAFAFAVPGIPVSLSGSMLKMPPPLWGLSWFLRPNRSLLVLHSHDKLLSPLMPRSPLCLHVFPWLEVNFWSYRNSVSFICVKPPGASVVPATVFELTTFDKWWKCVLWVKPWSHTARKPRHPACLQKSSCQEPSPFGSKHILQSFIGCWQPSRCECAVQHCGRVQFDSVRLRSPTNMNKPCKYVVNDHVAPCQFLIPDN